MRDKTAGDLLYGHSAIAEHLGITVRQAKHRCRAKQIPSFKMDGARTVCASRAVLDAWLADLAARARKAPAHA